MCHPSPGTCVRKFSIQLELMNKKSLTEADIRTKFITPAIEAAGWDMQTQMRKEYFFTAGRIIVRGKLVARGKGKKADDLLYLFPD